MLCILLLCTAFLEKEICVCVWWGELMVVILARIIVSTITVRH